MRMNLSGHISRFTQVAGTVTALLVLITLIAVPRAVTAQADAAVIPPVGGPGTEFAFFATDFEDGEKVGYWLNAPDGSIVATDEETFANDDGRADWTWDSPDNAMLGTWEIVAEGEESGTTWVIPFEIESGLPESGDPAPRITDGDYAVEPPVGPPGTEFEFFATGFESNELVGFWLNAPDGSVVDIEGKADTTEGGRVDWSWDSPDDAMRGTWEMVVRGVDSNLEQVIPFEIR